MRTLEIPLTQGKVARVSERDFAAVSAHRWHATRHRNDAFYARAYIAGRSVYMHRFICGLEPGRSPVVDHIDHDGLNNTRENLRVCSPSENLFHRKRLRRANAKPGVWFQSGGWVARIAKDREIYYLGSYRTEHEASIAYDAAAKVLYGDFMARNAA